MSILVKIVNSRLEYSNETFSFRKQYNYTNLFVHSCERCLSKGRVLQRFCPLGTNFYCFCGKSTNCEEKLSAFLGNGKLKKGKLLNFWLT